MLEDLIMAATNEALRKIDEAVPGSLCHKMTRWRLGGGFRSDMDYYSSEISKLIEELSQLPGIGAKSAQRLAFHIHEYAKGAGGIALVTAIIACEGAMSDTASACYTLTDEELCPICKDAARDHKTIMVVENTRDLVAYEKTGKYDGRVSCAAWRNFPHAWNRSGGYPAEGADGAP